MWWRKEAVSPFKYRVDPLGKPRGNKHFPATLRLYTLKKKRKTPPRELKTFGINTIVFITLRDN